MSAGAPRQPNKANRAGGGRAGVSPVRIADFACNAGLQSPRLGWHPIRPAPEPVGGAVVGQVVNRPDVPARADCTRKFSKAPGLGNLKRNMVRMHLVPTMAMRSSAIQLAPSRVYTGSSQLL